MSNADAIDASADGAERRQTIRRPLRGLAEVTFAGRPAAEVRTLDISPSGMGIVAATNPASRTACLIRFALPTKPTQTQLALKAVVMHSVYSSSEGNFRVGLLFANLATESADAINAYLASAPGTQVDRIS